MRSLSESPGQVLRPKRNGGGGRVDLYNIREGRDPGDYLAKSPDYPDGETEDQVGEVICLRPQDESRTIQDLPAGSRPPVLPTAHTQSEPSARHSSAQQPTPAQAPACPFPVGLS